MLARAGKGWRANPPAAREGLNVRLCSALTEDPYPFDALVESGIDSGLFGQKVARLHRNHAGATRPGIPDHHQRRRKLAAVNRSCTALQFVVRMAESLGCAQCARREVQIRAFTRRARVAGLTSASASVCLLIASTVVERPAAPLRSTG